MKLGPVWMNRHVEACINQLSNVELIELLDMFDEIEKPSGESK